MNRKSKKASAHRALLIAALVAGIVTFGTYASSAADSTPGPAPQSPADEVRGALFSLSDNFDTIVRKMGSDQAVALQERLNTDLGWMPGAEPAPGYTVAEWNERVAHEAQLDASIVSLVISGTQSPLAGARGLVERTTVSRVDGLLTTYALYVPANVGQNPPLVVLLHGNPQTETNILGARFFRDLADRDGAIVVAPFGRGIYDFAPPADDDVYQVTDEVSTAFHVASNRIYLVGYSMGGFSVFKIGPEHADRWVAIMAIAGAALGSQIDSISAAFAHKPVYVVTGTHDESIPTQYPQNTAIYLKNVGVPTGLYIQPSGTHYIPTIMPMISEAWQDMMAGKIRSSATPRGMGGVTQMPMNSFDIPPGMRP